MVDPRIKFLHLQHKKYEMDRVAWHKAEIKKEAAQAKKNTRSVIKKTKKPAKPLEQEGCCAFAAAWHGLGWPRIVEILTKKQKEAMRPELKAYADKLEAVIQSIQKNPQKLNRDWIKLLRETITSDGTFLCKTHMKPCGDIDYGGDPQDISNILLFHEAKVFEIVTETTVEIGHEHLNTPRKISTMQMQHNPLCNRKHKNFLMQDPKHRRHPDSPTQYYIVMTRTHVLAMSTTGTEPTQLTFYDQRGAVEPKLVKNQRIDHLWRIEFLTT